ncbi:2174_t:CDS:2 [Ambispora leptoticha]|uniref:2174_t:CDS:1 n=1 Tax=Ambispora leptoticha TaxID=144679 RepID=A0A9N9FB57_9GLOM|nr:2174_t:CDS:2 [Ambispora leptoticha]
MLFFFINFIIREFYFKLSTDSPEFTCSEDMLDTDSSRFISDKSILDADSFKFVSES